MPDYPQFVKPALSAPSEGQPKRWAAGLLGLLLLCSSLFLYSRHNDFPYFYHPDEAGKAAQILSGEWNFHHPLLMLQAARLGVDLLDLPHQEQRITEIGRWVSACMAAMAIVAFSLLAARTSGTAAMICVGLLLVFHHQPFELAHYFKEDTTLLAGVALCLLALSCFCDHPSLHRCAWLGVTSALALSGKYLGAALIPVCLGALVWNPSTRKTSRYYLVYCACLAAAAAAINFPVLQQLAAFNHGFDRELAMVVHGQSGVGRSIPHAQYWNIFRDNTNPLLWGLLAFYFYRFFSAKGSKRFDQWVITLLPVVFALALSFSPKSNDRYFLPATALFTLQAGLGAVELGRILKSRFGFALPLLALAAVLSQIPSFHRYWQAFQQDDRAAVRAWIEQNLPSSAVLVVDPRSGLPVTDKKTDAKRQPPLAQKVLGKKYAADFGSLEELRAQGVTHVVVSESDYGRFLLQSLKPHDSYKDTYDRNRLFYERLFKEGTLLWSRDRGTVIYLHPGIRVYAL